MLVHPQCVSHGLTLTAASMVIWYSPTTSLETYDQLNARIVRIGQRAKQQILHLQGSPVEKRIYKLLQEHQRLQNMFLQLVEGATDDAKQA
jgi:SNF2 family DNA or RNA helicase